MINPVTIRSVATLGLGVVLSIGVFSLCVWLVKHMIRSQSEERKRWGTLMENHVQHNTEVLRETCNSLKTHNESTKDAHEYQKQEHKAIAETLIEAATILRSLNGKT